MDDNDDEFDLDFDMTEVLEAMEQAEHQSKARHGPSSHTKPTTSNSDKDEFGDDFDDDFDVDALVQAVDAVEQQKATTTAARPMAQSSLVSHFAPSSSRTETRLESSGSTARITFGMTEDMEDPTPPPPPPPDARTFHPFDSQNLPTWIYPTNHPIRGYQFNIVRKALFNNTLVSIPTGLGKTFIAAVVMYNYYRWFPNSILIFMAPTRPLVEQQIKACYDVCGLPQKDTTVLVGTSGKAKRAELWKNGRVFFCTPQVVDNDLTNGTCPAHKVAMVVIDEAHRATGNFAYTTVIEKLERIHGHFRILGLSATPGSTIDKVQTVVNNLRINSIQVRTEESMDVQEFSFGKRVQTVVIKLTYTTGATGIVPKTATTFCQQFLQPVLDRLARNRAIQDPTPERCSPFKLLSDRQSYNINAKNVPNAVKRKNTVDFLIAEAYSRAYEGLCIYGVAAFVDSMERFLQTIRTTLQQGKNVPFEQQKILSHVGLRHLLDNLRQQIDTPGFVSHPKLDSLLSIILNHLNAVEQRGQTSTRIMVFSTLRASVTMIVQFLSVHHPMIRCAPFVGQAGDSDGVKGMNQKEQQQTIDKFKKGEINVIVATSIGEEGLDIGEVDLIVCYDSQSSSIRLLQRMGRTGRRRQGHCVMLMTETEERKFKKATDSYKYIQNMIANGNTIECSKANPNLLPLSYQPVVQRKKLVIGHYMPVVQGKKRKRQPEFDKDGMLSTFGRDTLLATLGMDTIDTAYNRFWPVFHPLKSAQKYLVGKNQTLGPTKRIGHSRRTEQFVTLVKNMESQINGVVNDSVLILPPKKMAGDTLVLPRRKDKAAALDVEDTAWSSFMQPLITKGVDDDDGPTMMDFDFDPVESPVLEEWMDDLQAEEMTDDLQAEEKTDDLQAQEDIPQKVPPEEETDDDEFGSMDLDFLEQVINDTPATKVSYSFDDPLPPGPTLTTTSPSNFTTTFAWATSRPIYSHLAKQQLIQRLQQSNKLYLSVRLLPSMSLEFEEDALAKSPPHTTTLIDSQSWAITVDLVSQEPPTRDTIQETGNTKPSSFMVDNNSVDSWEIHDDDEETNVKSVSLIQHSTPIRPHGPMVDYDDFEIRAPYTLSPIDSTRTPIGLLLTPENRIGTPTRLSFTPSSEHCSPIILRRRQRRILDDSDEEDAPRVKSKQRRYMENNPFLDMEAIRSDDEVATGDEDDEQDDQSAMNSFICDGSSGLVPEEGVEKKMDLAMYRTSLHQGPSTDLPVFSTYRRKTWLDKMSTEKWELAANDQDEDEEHEEDEHEEEELASSIMDENISSYTNASDDFI